MGGICQPPVLRVPQSLPTPTPSTGSEMSGDSEVRGSFNYHAPMDNIVTKNFQFPVR